jgi:hypothetical protein
MRHRGRIGDFIDFLEEDVSGYARMSLRTGKWIVGVSDPVFWRVAMVFPRIGWLS